MTNSVISYIIFAVEHLKFFDKRQYNQQERKEFENIAENIGGLCFKPGGASRQGGIMSKADNSKSQPEPQTTDNLMALIKQHAVWARNLQARVNAVQKDQKLLAEQLIRRVDAGESLSDRILDFMVRQEDLIVTWLTDGGRLEYNLRELDRVISENAGQTVMLAVETVEEVTLGVKHFLTALSTNWCVPEPTFTQTRYDLILGNLKPGGLLMERERWFLPLDGYICLNPPEAERKFTGNVPLPSPRHLFSSSAHSALGLEALLGWRQPGVGKEVEMLVGASEIRQWLGKCESEQLNLRILEILDELEPVESENKEDGPAPQEPSPES